jgi:drug/metabolite transporter (DMT)-like permease
MTSKKGSFLMHYLFLSIICSVLVSVLLKRAAHHRIDVAQAVTWNYAVAAVLCALLLRPALAPLQETGAPWPALLALAVVLPSLFLVFARTVALAGIVRSDAAQRLSLVLSLAAAFVLFGETLNAWKFAGLATGALALAGLLARPVSQRNWRGAWPWLLATCAGYALVDILLKRIALAGTTAMTALQVCFVLAFVLMLALQGLRAWHGTVQFNVRSLFGGVLLGVLNFGNILFYVRAHQALPESPATVFAGMNIGVVALGTLVGMAVFGEKTSVVNRIGVVLAVIAIGLVARG